MATGSAIDVNKLVTDAVYRENIWVSKSDSITLTLPKKYRCQGFVILISTDNTSEWYWLGAVFTGAQDRFVHTIISHSLSVTIPDAGNMIQITNHNSGYGVNAYITIV